MSDFKVIENILIGHQNDYRILVEKYQEQIFRICIGYIHNEDDANDLTQETFIKAFNNLSSFKFKSSFSTWVYRIAVNICLNHLRKRKVNILDRIENSLDSLTSKTTMRVTDYSNPEEILITEEHRKVIFNEIDKLSDKQKTAFILSKYDELPQKEIAKIMQITEGAVESLIQRAKNNLQKRLSKVLKQDKQVIMKMILIC